MVDLQGQYLQIKTEIDSALQRVVDSSAFIRGPEVESFESELSDYLGGVHVLGVGNGTDALQIALMALGVGPGDEVITPSFTFVATAEAVGLLGATVVFADINPDTFTIDPPEIESLISDRTRAIIPVHLFGQCANMTEILAIGEKHGIPVIEDAAQAIGAMWRDRHGGTMGEYGTLSFFPSKNLGCFGDGGAVLSPDADFMNKARLISNHGSSKKYHNEIVGINSRLDAIQAAVLSIKLNYLHLYNAARRESADRYDRMLKGVRGVKTPERDPRGTHVFHQYTLRVLGNDPEKRDALQAHLKSHGIPSFVYYPVPLHLLPIYRKKPESCRTGKMGQTLCAANEVLSLPMHTELGVKHQSYISDTVAAFFQ